MTYEEQCKIEQLNKQIFDNIIKNTKAENFIDYYMVHNQKETCEHFGLRTKKQLAKVLTYFGYDFSTKKPSPFKGKKAARSHESYVAGGKKSAETQKTNWQNKPEEEKEAWAKKQAIAHSSEKFRAGIKQINLDYWASLSTEEKAQILRKRSEANKRAEGKAHDKAYITQGQNCMEANQALVDKYLAEVLSSDFPYDFLPSDQIIKEYKKICAKEPVINSNTGLSLVEHFHPSIWRCNKLSYKSPVDAWHDPVIISKTIQNRLKYIGPELSLRQIRRGLSVGRFAPKVSVFRPMTAKYLIKKYLNGYSTIFDPCMGFSGRMLGACVLGKRYIGQDINSVTIKESNKIKDYFKLAADLRVNDSIYDSGEYECLFTCPPYGNKERWHQDIEELSADEWIDVCLKNYDCEAYLFVVDDTAKYKSFIVEEIKNKSHFNATSEKVIFIKKDSSKN